MGASISNPANSALDTSVLKRGSKNENTQFVFVVGPTATGKSQWALEQAQKYQGSILNIDSVQFYKGLEIGSAAPSAEDFKTVPHFMYSYVEAPQEMTAGQYIRDFYELVQKEKLPSPVFIVGGTGFYIQALEKGMYDLPPIEFNQRESIEKELETMGAEKLHQELTAADPQHIIHVNDHYRLVRAIEVLRFQGKTPSQLKSESEQSLTKNAFPFSYIKVGFLLEKEAALAKVQKRTQGMLKNGIIEETERFIQKGFQTWAPLSSVGYKDVMDYLLHNTSKSNLEESIIQSTMRLVKKQKTWFKRDTTVLWSDFSDKSLEKLDHELEQFITRFDPQTTAKR